MAEGVTDASRIKFGNLGMVVGFLVFVELTSGVIQGFYVPLLTDIARYFGVPDADVNWLEGAQAMVAAIVIPAFAKLGDMIGHRKMLLITTAVTALASVLMPLSGNFWLFLAAWALQGFYVVWLPLETALIYSRARSTGHPAVLTRRAAGALVGALEIGVIVAALSAGQLVDVVGLPGLLWIPAIAVVACFFVILFGVKESPELHGGRFDTIGLVLVAIALLGLTGGLFLLRVYGPASPAAWAVLVLGVVLFVPFVLWERRTADPVIEVRMFADPTLWPVFLTAGLFGVSVLGAQAPLSTFARTDPAVGYGLGATSGQTSILIGAYVLTLAIGALMLPVVTKFITPRWALVGASALVGVGYLLFLPLHATYVQTLTNMIIAGLGSGALVAALPAAAATAAPHGQTGVATGLTNSVKTVGGAIASAVFGIALATHAPGSDVGTAGSFTGYLTVWIVCGTTALVAAVALLFVPKTAFSDAAPSAE
ncbi:MAG: MFS transporter [Actinobacteria bacterium HGW-Actinobacteria-2]|nr:MAG: MFS transporter [Actinobacteria bacterium HGW-Actinobacteria-2]